MEVPSEDPFHSGQYGVAYTKGLQWGDDPRYTKAIGALKHYTIYSVENSGGVEGGDVRGSSYFPIAMRDIEETYLPQFKAPVGHRPTRPLVLPPRWGVGVAEISTGAADRWWRRRAWATCARTQP